MTDSETKLAVLRGVYEDNLGIPRTHSGKRAALQGAAVPAADDESSTALAPPTPVRRSLMTRAAVLLVLGVGLFGVYVQGVAPAGGGLQARAMPAQAVAIPYPMRDAVLPPRSMVRVPLIDSVDPSGAVTAQYDAMLGDLGVSVAELFGLTVHTIVIDPGHGGRDPGALGHQGLQEKQVTLDIARRLRDKLEASGDYRVILTRDADTSIKLKDRVAFTKAQDADLFISIHINSVPEEAGGVNYVETYYFGPHADPRTLALAETENRGSDYAMGDFREIIARIGDTMKTEESAHLASAIHENLYNNLKRHSTNLLDAGAKAGPFVVLLGVEVPSVLVEVSCISNEAEAVRLGTPGYRDDVAEYLKTGVVEYLKRRAPHTQPDGVSTQYVAQQAG